MTTPGPRSTWRWCDALGETRELYSAPGSATPTSAQTTSTAGSVLGFEPSRRRPQAFDLRPLEGRPFVAAEKPLVAFAAAAVSSAAILLPPPPALRRRFPQETRGGQGGARRLRFSFAWLSRLLYSSGPGPSYYCRESSGGGKRSVQGLSWYGSRMLPPLSLRNRANRPESFVMVSFSRELLLSSQIGF